VKSTRTSYALSILALGLILFTSSCSDSALTTIAKFESDLNAACATTFTVVAAATTTTPPLIATADAAAIITVLTQIETANRQAETATASIATLSPANQTNLLAIMAPIQTAINNSVANGTLGIKDPATQQKVQLALVAIQAIVNTGVAFIQAVKT
jgi:hypothetical protein